MTTLVPQIALALLTTFALPVSARAVGVWSEPHHITPGQIAGIVVGSLAAVGFVIGAVFLCIYLRRRDRNRFQTLANRRSLQTMQFMEQAQASASAVLLNARTARADSTSAQSDTDKSDTDKSHAPSSGGNSAQAYNPPATSLRPPPGGAPLKPMTSAEEDRMLYN